MIFSRPGPHRRFVRESWLEILRRHGAGQPITLLEIGAGASDLLPRTLADYNPRSRYITVNENRRLTLKFRRKTMRLPIRVEIIEDDAANIAAHPEPESVDILAFEHSMNDILQAILLGQGGIDTTRGSWFSLLPAMIKRMNEIYRGGQFETALKAPFMALLRGCADTLRPGGLLALSHYMFQLDLNLGYDPYLWENMLPIVRPWLRELSGGHEIELEGYDPQWWFFWQKAD